MMAVGGYSTFKRQSKSHDASTLYFKDFHSEDDIKSPINDLPIKSVASLCPDIGCLWRLKERKKSNHAFLKSHYKS